MRPTSGEGMLPDAIAAGAPAFATGYAFSPQRFILVRRAGTSLSGVNDSGHVADADLRDVYQLVLFDKDGVFRWSWDQRHRLGRWSWLSDEVAKEKGWSRLDASRLVIGSVKRVQPGWAQTGDGSSSPLWVPISGAKKDDRLQLHVVEYVSKDEHGNLAVVADRPCAWGINANA